MIWPHEQFRAESEVHPLLSQYRTAAPDGRWRCSRLAPRQRQLAVPPQRRRATRFASRPREPTGRPISSFVSGSPDKGHPWSTPYRREHSIRSLQPVRAPDVRPPTWDTGLPTRATGSDRRFLRHGSLPLPRPGTAMADQRERCLKVRAVPTHLIRCLLRVNLVPMSLRDHQSQLLIAGQMSVNLCFRSRKTGGHF